MKFDFCILLRAKGFSYGWRQNPTPNKQLSIINGGGGGGRNKKGGLRPINGRRQRRRTGGGTEGEFLGVGSGSVKNWGRLTGKDCFHH